MTKKKMNYFRCPVCGIGPIKASTISEASHMGVAHDQKVHGGKWTAVFGIAWNEEYFTKGNKMTKSESKRLVRALESGENPRPDWYENNPGLLEPLCGLGLPDFPKGKSVSFEVALYFLRWQCLMLNGNIDEQELSNCLELFKEKKVRIL